MTKLYCTNSLNEDDLQWKTKDDLKILKVEYLSNHLLDHTKIFNLSLDDHTLFCNALK